ncbi:DUF6221 family protein [Streptomyces alfalfae]
MTAQGEGILAWLDNAISVHESAATAAAVPYGRHWVQGFPEQHKVPGLHYAWDADMVHLSQTDPHMAYQCLTDEIAALTVMHDPASVLRRCAADRKLVESLKAVIEGDYIDDGEPVLAEHVLEILAEGYGWPADEREQRKQRRCGYAGRHSSHSFMRLEVLFQCPGAESGEETSLPSTQGQTSPSKGDRMK